MAELTSEGSDVERIGVFGGTFDPPHNGHLVVACGALEVLDLDRLLIVVAGEPWQKVGERPVTPAVDRVAMVRALVEGTDGLEVCDVEVRRAGPTYTADTLAELSRPGRDLYLILGGDAANGLSTWERLDEVRRLAKPVLVDRPGFDAPTLLADWDWVRVDVPRLEISSSDLRDRLAAGRPVDGLVAPQVISCIRSRRLYSEDD